VVAVVAILLVIGAVTAYFVTRPVATTRILVFDQPEQPDTLDPAVTFTTPGWGICQQIYQTLVMYNGTSYTTYSGILAQSWTTSADHFNITFHLRSGVHFSNGDPFSAYTMWFSLYRTLVMNQAPTFILTQNFWFPHTNSSSTSDEVNASTAQVATQLNTGNFVTPGASLLAAMQNPDQSFQVIDAQTLQVNLGRGYLGEVPYTYIFATLAAPVAAAVDPLVIQAHGGVTNSTNDWMTTHMTGTGPYVLSSYTPGGTGFTISPDPNYWGVAAAAAEPWNNNLQPAKSTIEIDFQSDPAIVTNDLKTGRVVGASFSYLGPSTVDALKKLTNLNVSDPGSVFASTTGAWWIYMDQQQDPFTNLSVRAAIAHAVNYNRIITLAFGGYANRWVGPVPPGYPYNNTENLAPYQYNLALARQYMNQSPWPITVNPTTGAVSGGYPQHIKYAYINLGDWEAVSTLLQADLTQIGINIDLVPITLDNLYVEQAVNPTTGACTTDTTTNGGPFYMGQEFYTSDYISPDDWTQNNAISYGSANQCMSRYANDTMDHLVLQAAGESNPANLTQLYSTITRMMYENYTNIWLVSPTDFAVTNVNLKGVVLNPMGSGLPYVMSFNTEYM
jgi:peptide/nickel transport system substrate-binding protein